MTCPGPLMPDLPAPVLELNKPRTNLVIISSAAAAVGTGVLVVQSRSGSRAAATTSTASAPAEDAAPAAGDANSTLTTPMYEAVTAESFTIKARTTSRRCFGRMGCALTVEPVPTCLGDSTDIDPDAAYDATCDIHADEYGSAIETAGLPDRTSFSCGNSVLPTGSSCGKITAKITDGVGW